MNPLTLFIYFAAGALTAVAVMVAIDVASPLIGRVQDWLREWLFKD